MNAPAWSNTDPPIRLITRIANVHILDAAVACAYPFGGDMRDGAIVWTIDLANTEYVIADKALSRKYREEPLPDRLRRPISIANISASTRISPETVRRRVLALAREGICVRHEGGLLVPSNTFARPAFGKSSGDLAGLFVELIRDLAAFDLLELVGNNRRNRAFSEMILQAGEEDIRRNAVLLRLLLLQFLTRTAFREGSMFAYGPTAGLIVMGLYVESLRSVHGDPVLSRQYATFANPVPVDQVVPVSMRALAARLKLPQETVRRHVNKLLKAGSLVVQKESGYQANFVGQEDFFSDHLRRKLQSLHISMDQLADIDV